MSRRRKWAFRLAAVVLAPLLFLSVLEAGLRLGGWGYPVGFFVRIEGRDSYTTNQKFGWRFFPPAIARMPVVCELPANKTETTCRIFILGDSAARGTPAPAFGFGRILQVMLEQACPGVTFEVVNTAMTAVNSHVVLGIARDCAAHEPDLFVVYMGNNEVVGPYGPGTVFAGYSPSRLVIRSAIAARGTRIGQLVERLGRRLRPGERTLTAWKGMELFLQNRVPADDPRLQKVYDHFRANLSDICDVGLDAGAGVILCTVASNLKDCPPFASLHRADLSEAEKARWATLYRAGIDREEAGKPLEAIASYHQASEIDGEFAELHFRLALCCLAVTRTEEARQHFTQARDLDALRFRADSRLNGIVRDVAAQDASDRVHLVDVEHVFAASGRVSDGITGDELFHEHVHMSFAGNYVLARAVLERVLEALSDRLGRHAANDSSLPSQEWCEERLALGPWDRYDHAKKMAAVTERPPFTSQLDHAATTARRRGRLSELKRRAASPEAMQETRNLYVRAIALRPADIPLRESFAMMLQEIGDCEAAGAQWDELVRRIPGVMEWHTALGASLVGQGRIPEGITHLRRALHIIPDAPQVYGNLGLALARQGDLAGALHEYDRALEIDSEYVFAHCGKAEVFVRQGRFEQAIQACRQVLRIEPEHPQTLNNLGAILLQQGRPDEAVEVFRKVLRADPDHVRAHTQLAEIMVGGGRTEEAIEHYEQLVRIDPAAAEPRQKLAHALLGVGRDAEAVEHFRTLNRLHPDSLPVTLALGLVLATHPDAQIRDGVEAVALAERACELTQYQNARALDLLAAACAEAGQFDRARATAARAHELASAAGDAALARSIRSHLEQYEQGKPVRASATHPWP